jgi:hypothetical protein
MKQYKVKSVNCQELIAIWFEFDTFHKTYTKDHFWWPYSKEWYMLYYENIKLHIKEDDTYLRLSQSGFESFSWINPCDINKNCLSLIRETIKLLKEKLII